MAPNRTGSRRRRRLALTLGAAAAALATGAGAAVAAPASAASSTAPSSALRAHQSVSSAHPATAKAAVYNGACGTGYSVIDSLQLSTLGTVYLTYNGATGNNCVVTVRATPGTVMRMEATIELSGVAGTYQVDLGDYTAYAGPVYAHAPGHCIDWSGGIGNTFAHQNNSHCALLTS